MATEGKTNKKGRKSKTGIRKSNYDYLKDYMPASDDYVNAVAAGQLSYQLGMPGNTIPDVQPYHTSKSPITGKPGNTLNNAPQRVAPAVTIDKKAAAQQPVAPYDAGGDQFDALNQLAMSMLTDSAGSTFDYETALQESAQAIKRAYGAEIKAIRNNNKSARKQTKRDRKDLNALYKGLAQSYGQAARQSEIAATNQAQDALNLAAQSNQTIANTQMQTTQQQAQMLKDLGLEATADQIITPDFAQSADSQAAITAQGNNAATMANQFGANNQQFFRAGKRNAKMEGINAKTDLMGDLRDYVRGNRDQIAVLKGQRARELSQNKSNTMSAAAEAEASSQEDMWNRLMEYIGVRTDIENTNFDNSLAAQKFQYDQQSDRADRRWDAKKFRASQQPGGENSLFPEQRTVPAKIVQQSSQPRLLTNILQELWGSPAFRFGQVTGEEWGAPNGESYKLTPDQAAAMAEKAGKQKGLSNTDIQLLKLAAYQSVG